MTQVRNAQRPSVTEEMAKLKDFQRDTVEYVHRRLWLDDDSTGRFLVADEVGLGKTLVGRGVVAKAIDHLWDLPRGERIDVVYICSNQQIARQNLRRLNVANYEIVEAGRLSMLPMVVGQMSSSRVNILSLTPGTSMDVARGSGTVRERALLHHLVSIGLGDSGVMHQQGWNRFFRGRVNPERYPYVRDREVDRKAIDAPFAREFVRQLRAEPYGSKQIRDDEPLPAQSLFDAIQALMRRIANAKLDTGYGVPDRYFSTWWYLIGRLRHLVAQAAVALLDPDLVILDEFQRFRKYLRDEVEENDWDRDAVELAQTIFNHRGKDGHVRVLLLSATPFAMFSAPGVRRGEGHEDDFNLTTTFLADAGTAQSIRGRQRIVRDAALGLGDVVSAKEIARSVEADLRKVMCRTERLALSADRDGMLRRAPVPSVVPRVPDLVALKAVDRLGRVVGANHSLFEYWRSAPYLVSLMEGYQVKQRIRAHAKEPSPEFVDAVTEASLQVPWARMSDYQQIDLGNAKLRALWDDLSARRAPDVPWIPASMPYYAHGGAFADAAAQGLTKRLVFSSWAVVPRAVSMLLSYQAEQVSAGDDDAYSKAHNAPLSWARGHSEDSLPTMGVLALVYPSFVLAELGDPRAVAANLGEIPVSPERASDVVAGRITEAISALPAGPSEGRADDAWYWAVPLVLDRLADTASFLTHLADEANREDIDDKESLYRVHLDRAFDTDLAVLGGLGRRPDDLVEVLTSLAMAGPGVCALRAMSRVVQAPSYRDPGLRQAAQAVGLAFRTLVSSREINQVVTCLHPRPTPYRLAVLLTCLEGNLQAVLDEFVHVLMESEGLQSKGDDERLATIERSLTAAMSLRAANPSVDLYEGEGTMFEHSQQKLRTHFAARYGREQTTESKLQTEMRVRNSFNSPFWPFVLASTSVGQEGLDFHTYCHAVVHWNLPTNPVDLEQREGRVHRYKGHAVRKNVAADFARSALDLRERDPWTAVFAAAREAAASQGLDELTPYWVYTREDGAHGHGASIERHVLANPLSQETARLDALLRTVTAYRLTIGQPRQEDLLEFVGDADRFGWMAMDLAPPTTSWRAKGTLSGS